MIVNGKDFSGKAINIAMNNGADENDLISKYSLSGVDELRKKLEELYHNNPSYVNSMIMPKLKRNNKRKKNHNRANNGTGQQATSNSNATLNVANLPTIPTESELSVIQTVTGEIDSSVDKSQLKIPTIPSEESTTQKLEEQGKGKKEKIEAILETNNSKEVEKLNAEISEAKADLQATKKSKKKLLSEKLEAQKRLRSIANRLSKLESEVRKLKAQAIVHVEIIKGTPELLIENSKMEEEANNKVKELEKKLQELQTITLAIDSDDSMRAKKFGCYLDDIKVPSKEIISKTAGFMSYEILEDFSLKEIKTIAKIAIAVEEVEDVTKETVQLVAKEQTNFTVAVELVTGKKVITTETTE